MPNEVSPQSLTQRVGMINETVKNTIACNNFMVVTYALVNGTITMNRFTQNFPKGDFNRVVTILQDDLTKELEKDQVAQKKPSA